VLLSYWRKLLAEDQDNAPLLAFAVALLAVGGTAMAITTDTSGTTSSSPTIQSDKADYAPGELVTLTGSN
jgi:hypothetical protein